MVGMHDPVALAQLARGRMRNKIAELERALTGQVCMSRRLLLPLHLGHIDDLNAKIKVRADCGTWLGATPRLELSRGNRCHRAR